MGHGCFAIRRRKSADGWQRNDIGLFITFSTSDIPSLLFN